MNESARAQCLNEIYMQNDNPFFLKHTRGRTTCAGCYPDARRGPPGREWHFSAERERKRQLAAPYALRLLNRTWGRTICVGCHPGARSGPPGWNWRLSAGRALRRQMTSPLKNSEMSPRTETNLCDSAGIFEQRKAAEEGGPTNSQRMKVVTDWGGRGEASLGQVKRQLTTALGPPAVDQMPLRFLSCSHGIQQREGGEFYSAEVANLQSYLGPKCSGCRPRKSGPGEEWQGVQRG